MAAGDCRRGVGGATVAAATGPCSSSSSVKRPLPRPLPARTESGGHKMADGELNVDSLITRLLEGERGAGQPRLPAAPRAYRGGREGAVTSPREPELPARWGEAGGAGSSRAAAGGAGAAPPPAPPGPGWRPGGDLVCVAGAPSSVLRRSSEGGGAHLSVLSALVCAGVRPPCLGEVAAFLFKMGGGGEASLSVFPFPPRCSCLAEGRAGEASLTATGGFIPSSAWVRRSLPRLN